MHTHNNLGFLLKKNVTIRIEKDLVEKARELGLNISKVSENALKDMIERIEGSKAENNPSTNLVDSTKKQWRGVRDLNPRGPKDHRLSRPAPCQARVTPQR